MGERRLPLTALQADHLRQLERRNAGRAYVPVTHCPAALVNLRGSIDHSVLERTVDAVSARQSALRVRFDGTPPDQLIEPDGRPLSEAGLPGPTAHERRTAALRRLAEASKQEFDPAQGMFEATLLGIDDAEAGLLIRADQLVCDLWSLNQLIIELGTTYAALAGGDDPPRPLPLDYSTAVEEDQRWLEDPAGRAARERAGRLVADVRALDLPAPTTPPDHPGVWRTVRWQLDGEAARQLAAACRGRRSTLSTAVLAALGAALGRQLGLDGVPVQLLLTGRDRPEHRPLVMWRSNPLPVWISGTDRPLGALLRTAQRAGFETLELQRVPWPVVVADHGCRSEFDVSLQYIPPALNAAGTDRLFADLDVETYLGTACLTGAAIDLLVSEDADGISVRCAFRQDLVAAGFVDAVLADIRRMLAALADGDDDFVLSA